MFKLFSLIAFFSFAQGFAPASANPLLSEPLIDIDGRKLDPASLKGKVVMVVNVASRCGYTPQYASLQKLYKKFQRDGFVIIGVPCNQFGWQEPGDSKEIKSFCRTTYNVTFPILKKQNVKGDDKTPLYASLVKSKVGDNSEVRWNFEKFLLNRSGEVVARFRSGVEPGDDTVLAAINKALTEKPQTKQKR